MCNTCCCVPYMKHLWYMKHLSYRCSIYYRCFIHHRCFIYNICYNHTCAIHAIVCYIGNICNIWNICHIHSPLDTDGVDDILFKQHQTTLKEPFNEALQSKTLNHPTPARLATILDCICIFKCWRWCCPSEIAVRRVHVSMCLNPHRHIWLWAARRALLHTHEMSIVWRLMTYTLRTFRSRSRLVFLQKKPSHFQPTIPTAQSRTSSRMSILRVCT